MACLDRHDYDQVSVAEQHLVLFAERAAGPGLLAGVAPLHPALWAREKGGKTQRLSGALGGLAEALGGDRAPIRVHLLDTSRGVAETDPVVRTVTTQ